MSTWQTKNLMISVRSLPLIHAPSHTRTLTHAPTHTPTFTHALTYTRTLTHANSYMHNHTCALTHADFYFLADVADKEFADLCSYSL